jgi:uncharacterized protein with FMN-binding domain
MKARKSLAVLFCAAVLMSTVSLEAARGKAQRVHLTSPSTVAGNELKSGTYVVKYEADGTNAKVTFLQGKKVVATVEGQLETRQNHYARTQVIFKTKPDGTRAITEIRFASPDRAIVFKE